MPNPPITRKNSFSGCKNQIHSADSFNYPRSNNYFFEEWSQAIEFIYQSFEVYNEKIIHYLNDNVMKYC